MKVLVSIMKKGSYSSGDFPTDHCGHPLSMKDVCNPYVSGTEMVDGQEKETITGVGWRSDRNKRGRTRRASRYMSSQNRARRFSTSSGIPLDLAPSRSEKKGRSIHCFGRKCKGSYVDQSDNAKTKYKHKKS